MKSSAIAQTGAFCVCFEYASQPTEGRWDLLPLSALYVCVFWRGEAGHLEIYVLAWIF